MKKLFILGNGFDISHCLPTTYFDFKKFLIEKAEDVKSFYPVTYLNKDGEIIVDKKMTAKLLVDLINLAANDKWQDFEDAMARYDYSIFFEGLNVIDAINNSDDDEMFKVAETRESIATDLNICVLEVKKFFSQWVDQIELNVKPQNRFLKLFDTNSLFLTFNYTYTLQKIYNINESQICHIHGKQHEEIIVGHGANINPYEDEELSTFAITSQLFNLFESLKKNVQLCYNKHISFFEKISKAGVTDIYTFGWALAESDLFYLKKIFSMIDTSKITWHLTEYDERIDKNLYKKDIITKCGFDGNFGQLIPEELA